MKKIPKGEFLKLGTAGWSIPREFKKKFPERDAQLESYSKVLNCVEINSTFSKIHKPSTFEKWALQTPNDFEFCLKLHRSFTHESDLRPKSRDLKNNFLLMNHLGPKWKVLLLQFSSKTLFHQSKMKRFYELIRKHYDGAVVLEPRNLSWMSKESKALMKEFKISKVLADPERCPHNSKNILSSGGVTYFRLHGYPDIYRSSYTKEFLINLCHELSLFKKPWCVFDNTALGNGTGNALTLRTLWKDHH